MGRSYEGECADLVALFRYDHLPPDLQAISRPFGELAHELHGRAANAQTVLALTLLLQAKDAAVRAGL